MTTLLTQAEVITIAGDGITLGRLIARRFRRYLPGYVERVLDVNQGLAAKGAILPVGTIVKLPVPKVDETEAAIEVVKLWE
jgi:phage tail protein X